MIYAEFYKQSTGYVEGSIPPRFSPEHMKPIPACGDRSVVVLDGRFTMTQNVMIARLECRKRGYIGFTINKGDNFTRSNTVRELELLA